MLLHFLTNAAAWVLHNSLEASAIVVLILLVRHFAGKRLSPPVQYGLWFVLLLRLVLPWTPQSPASLFNLFPMRPDEMPRISASAARAAEPAFILNAENALGLRVPDAAQPLSKSAPTAEIQRQRIPSATSFTPGKVPAPTGSSILSGVNPLSFSLASYLALLWLAGAIAVFGRAIAQSAYLSRAVRRQGIVTSRPVLNLLEECKAAAGIRTQVALVVTERVSSPALFGMMHPKVLLPAGSLDVLGSDQLRHVLLHELAHVARRDIATNWLITFLQSLHWFNPVLWYAFACMRADRELASDALALSHARPGEATEYGRTFVYLLEQYAHPGKAPSLAGLLENQSQMKRRISMIANYETSTRERPLFGFVIIAALGVLCLTSARSGDTGSGTEVSNEIRRPQQLPGALKSEYSKIEPQAETPGDGVGVWEQRSAAEMLPGRSSNAAVWTGKELLVFGGEGMNVSFGDGARYDFAEDVWQPLPRRAEPNERTSLSGIWTGDEMIVWGGFGGSYGNDINRNDGARYNPSTDSWHRISTKGAPRARFQHSAVWTGKEMIVWGGYTDSHALYAGCKADAHLNTGGLYNPSTDTWTSTTITGAPGRRLAHVGLWTGKRMIIWGGSDATGPIGNGAMYDPETNTWKQISDDGAPSARSWPVAVWTGTELVVWGGNDEKHYLQDGARYNPETDRWTPISGKDAPIGRILVRGVWTGKEMLVWGGVNDAVASGVGDPRRYASTGACYNPESDTWRSITLEGAPSGRLASAVWTGEGLLVFGGYNNKHLNDTWFCRI